MKRFDKIAIIGVGLIGGSIGLAIKKRGLAKEVIGVFHHKSTRRRALKAGALDKGEMSIAAGVVDADLVIIASPVHDIPKIIKETVKHVKDDAVITDVGSTKKWIVKEAEKILSGRSNVFFVGSHPMAGSEKTGVEAAKDNLLEGAPCIVTKTRRTNNAAIESITHFWRKLGSKVSVMTPEEHDKGIAFVSHLPHLVAFSIAGTVPEKYIKYAAEGFGDTTRVASSDPKLWADILLTNKKEILASAAAFEKTNRMLKKILEQDDAPSLKILLRKAKAKRDKFKYGKKT